MKPILEIQNISKKFRISHQTGGYLSLRERMVNALKFEKINTEDFWALKDVSFEVQAGESIGIIGRNGAGKSTLLKILSKITPPTTGKIISRGRIASLLEVGTGFHPELTGRENIFFNGSLLGMKRKEIESKFDEIVDFSGVEKFLDTPLKHYSSGMQLRLAFAVAAFLEPEILIIDEVLAVGDAEFQKKCLGKMEDVSKSGRTILFVSHNMAAIRALCSSAILFEHGKVKAIGNPSDLISEYMTSELTPKNEHQIFNYKVNDNVFIKEFGVSTHQPEIFSELGFVLSLESKKTNLVSGLAILVYNSFQERIAIMDLRSNSLSSQDWTQPEVTIKLNLTDLPLVEGVYYIGVYLESDLFIGNVLDLLKITVRGSDENYKAYPVQVRGTTELKYEFEMI